MNKSICCVIVILWLLLLTLYKAPTPSFKSVCKLMPSIEECPNEIIKGGDAL